MKNLARILAILFGAAWFYAGAQAQVLLPVDRQNVTVCPASEDRLLPPPLTASGCQVMPAAQVDPQGTHIWVLFNLPLKQIPDGEPLGLFVFAKASSHVFLNGDKVGENGRPGSSKLQEVPGRMDHVFPLRRDQMIVGDNSLAIRMSSHSGPLNLFAPIHAVFVSKYQSPQAATLRTYWPSLLPFGAFALGAFYFLTMMVKNRERLTSGLLCAMSVLAGVQLLAEVSRGLLAYTYPLHDVRLLVIALCSAGFGVLLAAYVIWRFKPQYKWPLLGVALIAAITMLIFPNGFDSKSSHALLAPTLLAAGVAFSALKDDRMTATIFAGSLLLFAAINFFGAGKFLDHYFYYVVSALMAFLFVQQANLLTREEQLRRQEAARAEKLQYVIDQLKENEDTFDLAIKSSGRIKRVNGKDIAFIAAAGDYAELTLTSGDTILHNVTLSELEAELPAFFLRVHRSYLVNTKLIESLDRSASGTGELNLTTAHKVPVSRRIMPSVRAALA